MSTIFISHSSSDNDMAKEVAERLAGQGHHSVFLDLDPEKGIVAGQSWERTLYRKLRACRAVIVVCTDRYLTSHWCFAEIALARMEGKHIIALHVDPLSPNAKMPAILTERQFIDLQVKQNDRKDKKEEGYQRLWRGLEEMDVLGVSNEWDPNQSPYLGLSAYQEQHASVFFGRDDETRVGLELLDRGAPGLVMVLGTSGSGKSSLVRAGMAPRLRRDTDCWLVVGPFRPRRDPFAELADAFNEAFQTYAHDESHSAETREQIRALRRAGSGAGADLEAGSAAGRDGRARTDTNDQRLSRLLQQLEDLYQKPPETGGSRLAAFLDWSLDDLRRICGEQPLMQLAAKTREHALALVEIADHLRRASSHREARVLLVVDQFEELLGHEHIADDANRFLDLLRHALEAEYSPLMALGTMRSDFLGLFQRNRVLLGIDFESLSVGPMSIDGMRRVIEEPAKLGAIELERGLADSLLEDTETPDALPLLSFTLAVLWKGKQNDTLTVRQYQELDGLHGAVAREAEAVLESARRQGKEDDVRRAFLQMARLTEDGSYARRPVSWDREEMRKVQPILEDFEQRRLLVTRMEAGEARTVEVAHEALFRSWAPLKTWLDDHRGELLLEAQLRREALAWEENNHAADNLWRGGRLQQALELMQRGELASGGPDRSLEERFVRAGQRQRQRQRWKRVGITAGVIALFLGVLGFYQWQIYKEEAKNLVQKIITASPAELPNLIERELPAQRRWADPLLETIAGNEGETDKAQLYTQLKLNPDDEDATNKARFYASVALDPEQWPPESQMVKALWNEARADSADHAWLLAVAAALAKLDAKGEQWSDIAKKAAHELSLANSLDVGGWIELLRPVKHSLSRPLASIFEASDPSAPDISLRIELLRRQQRKTVLDVLGKYDVSPDILVRLTLAAEPTELDDLFPFLEQRRDEVAKRLQAALKPAASSASERSTMAARRRATAVLALIRLDGSEEAWSELKLSDDPTTRSWMIHLLEQSGISARTLFERLKTESDASIRQALILGLVQPGLNMLPV